MAAKRPELFSLPHFQAYTSRLVLDHGGPWLLEDFQAEIAESILEPIRRLMAGESGLSSEVVCVLPTSNGKTSLMAGLALYLADFSPLPFIPVGASSRDQAEILAQQAYQMIRMSPGMLKRFRIYEGYRRIQPIRKDHPAPGSRGIKVLAADASTGDGVIPFPLAICDEGHRHQDMRLYRLWRGKLQKRGGVIAMISTAGVPGHEFEELRDKIRNTVTDRERHGAHVISRGPYIVMHEWMVEREEWVSDMAKVKEANPLAAITEASLQAQFDSPTMDLGQFKRLNCNIPSRSDSAAVSAAEWDHAYINMSLPDGCHLDLGVDVAWKHDTFAIVPCWRGPGYRLLGKPEVLVPPRDGSMLHPDQVKIAFEQFTEHFQVDTVVMDEERAEDIAAWLEDECGVRVVAWPRSNSQAAADYEAFMAALRSHALRHNGDRVLRTHVMNAVARPLPGDKRRFDRSTQTRGRAHQDERVIDALAAASFVNSYAANPPSRAVPMRVEDYRIVGL